MSSQINNNYTTAPTSPNPYIMRKLNNMEEARLMKKERNNWVKMYHKTLKRLEAMIDVQRQVKNMMKITARTNTIITEMEDTILKASTNNWVTNMMNIAGISEDLKYLIQSDIENQVFQIQWMLADELNTYEERGNSYVEDNIQEIQDLFKEEEHRKEDGKIEDEEVILVRLYEVSQAKSSTSSSITSFIIDEVDNLLKYMKFVQSPIQTRLFKPLPHYQSLKFRDEQDLKFWKEVATVLVDKKHNTETARNRYQIPMFQEGPLHEPYFIAINNREQIIIGPSKKTVAIYVVGELEVLI